MDTQNYKDVGRNDPCPCGSTKKFKKCHGENTPWQGNVKAAENTDTAATGASIAQNDLDPSKMDLNYLTQFSSAIQQLPKGQLQHLQALMQKAMAGKEVGRELEEFQRKLPTSFQKLLNESPKIEEQIAAAQDSKNAGTAPLTELADKLTDEQKQQLQKIQKNNEKAGLSRLWNRFKKK